MAFCDGGGCTPLTAKQTIQSPKERTCGEGMNDCRAIVVVVVVYVRRAPSALDSLGGGGHNAAYCERGVVPRARAARNKAQAG